MENTFRARVGSLVRFTYMLTPHVAEVMRIFPDGWIKVQEPYKGPRGEFYLDPTTVTVLCPRCRAHPATCEVHGSICCRYCEDTLLSIASDAQAEMAAGDDSGKGEDS